MGTALAKEQVALLKKLGVKVIVVMDNDSAGEMASISIGQNEFGITHRMFYVVLKCIYSISDDVFVRIFFSCQTNYS